VLLDRVCEPVKRRGAVGGGDIPPGRERPLRALHGGVGLLDSGPWHLGQNLLGCRLYDRNSVLARHVPTI
jgi:hypothetical protein